MTPARRILGQMALPVMRSRLPTASRCIHSKASFPRPIVSRTVPGVFGSAPSRRWNSSTSSTEALEVPDYLNEAELKIFNMLKDHFKPSKLEVCYCLSSMAALLSNANTVVAGAGHQRWMRQHVRSRHCIGTVQGVARDKATQTGELGTWRGDQEMARCTTQDQGIMREESQ